MAFNINVYTFNEPCFKISRTSRYVFLQDVRVDDKSTSHDPKSFVSISKYAKDFRKASAKASVPSLCVVGQTYTKHNKVFQWKNVEDWVMKIVR